MIRLTELNTCMSSLVSIFFKRVIMSSQDENYLTQKMKLNIMSSVFIHPTAAVVAKVDFALPRSMI